VSFGSEDRNETCRFEPIENPLGQHSIDGLKNRGGAPFVLQLAADTSRCDGDLSCRGQHEILWVCDMLTLFSQVVVWCKGGSDG
jgi:hypothetical protein